MKVLVIDDDPAILELVSQYLSLSAQHDVRSVSSARDALAAIEADSGQGAVPFECFLVDIQMPGVDGITLVEFIRERPEHRHTPIIMLTAMEDKDHVDRAFAAGATDYVTKPFDFYDLQFRIHAAENAAHAKDRAEAAASDAPRTMLSDPISLPDIDRAIDFSEFENYVRQLVSRRLYRVSVIAVKVGGVEQIHAKFSDQAFHRVIHDVAEEICDTLLNVGGILSYRGDGLFLCIPDRRLQGRRNAIQKALNKRHRVVHPTLGRFPSTLYVGEQIPLGSGSDASVLAALSLAVESAENQILGTGERREGKRPILQPVRRGGSTAAWSGTGEPAA
ncbi:MAG: two-component system response regulator [Rhodobacterales bacterium]|nr:MAG: two-component system response regulator [Rhodobacterales bacterium]